MIEYSPSGCLRCIALLNHPIIEVCLFWYGSRCVLLFHTAHEELQGSSQEDIWVDET